MNHSEKFQLLQLCQIDPLEDVALSPLGSYYFSESKWHQYEHTFSRSFLEQFKNDIAEKTHQQLSLRQPTVDSIIQLNENLSFRAHIAISPLVIESPQITLRKIQTQKQFNLESFSLCPEASSKIHKAIKAQKNILIAGQTGCGKTSFLKALLALVPQEERVLMLEDSPELPAMHPLCVRMLSRHDRFGSKEGSTWTLSDLVFECLRMRPDRIVVGECRSHEAKGLLEAMNTGHAGCMSTIHAGSAEEALKRFDDLAETSTKKCSASWDLVIHLHLSHGQRKIQELQWHSKN